MKPAERPFLTVQEVADKLGISRGRAYQLISDGTIPAVRLSPRRIRIPASAFETWLARQSDLALAGTRGGLPINKVSP